MPTAAQIVTRIDEKIYDILNDPSAIASYKIGDKSVNKVEIIRELRALRETYQTMAAQTPYEDIKHIAFDLDDFGQEVSEVIGDPLV